MNMEISSKKFEALSHQIEKSSELLSVLKDKGLAYLAGQVRSGKTLTAILTAEAYDCKSILVLTKKAAIDGWYKFDSFMNKDWTITNYEQITKLKNRHFDLIIIDEAHNLGQIGKPSLRVKAIRQLSYQKPVILMSGTPQAETKASIYHQMCITKNSPFNEFRNFYRFFAKYGVIREQWLGSRKVLIYKDTVNSLDEVVKPYFVIMTQQDAGIIGESQDQIHYVELSEKTKALYNELLLNNIMMIDSETIVCDSEMKLRMTLHQLETGDEKFDYIRKTFSGKIAVMSHFINERERLEKALPNVDVYSSNRHAEGVDLSHYDHFVILSGDYSGSKFIQRRERNVNINNEKQAVVHHILVRGAISEQVYNTVSEKKDFNNSTFKRIEL